MILYYFYFFVTFFQKELKNRSFFKKLEIIHSFLKKEI